MSLHSVVHVVVHAAIGLDSDLTVLLLRDKYHAVKMLVLTCRQAEAYGADACVNERPRSRCLLLTESRRGRGSLGYVR